DAVRNHSFPSLSLLLGGLTILARQLRSYHLRMIHGRDYIAVAAQVSAKKGGRPPMRPARMRVDDQRIGSGPGCSIAYSHLRSRCVAWRNREDVLRSWCSIQ